jgi:hypothetical protein
MNGFYEQPWHSNMCGLFALNNLLGKKERFTSKDLNECCKALSPKENTAYKSFFGGDYDVTVLIHALANDKKSVRWLKGSEDVG